MRIGIIIILGFCLLDAVILYHIQPTPMTSQSCPGIKDTSPSFVESVRV